MKKLKNSGVLWQCKTSIFSWYAVYLSQVCTQTVCERAVYALPYLTCLLVARRRPTFIEEPITTIIRYAWPVDATSANKATCDIWIMRHKLRLRSKLACFEFKQKVCSTRATFILSVKKKQECP